MKKMIFVGAVALLASCAPKTTEVVADVEPVSYPTAEIEQGHGLYDAKCQKCHKLKTIDNYTTEQWAEILPRMVKKAKMEDAETALVQEFVTWELQN